MAEKKGGQKRGIWTVVGDSSPERVVNEPRGPSSDSQAKKTRSIEEVMGIEALEFGDFEVGEILTPNESLVQLRQQSELNRTFSA